MKRLLLMTATMLFSSYIYGQTWDRIGNIVTTGQFLGSTNNFPLIFRTANVNRMKLNESISYSINGSNDVRAGYLLIGRDMPLWAGGPNELYSNVGAFSLLHLIGDDSPFVQEGEKIC